MRVLATAWLAVVLPVAAAAPPNPGEGRKLVDANKCEACHQGRFPGPAGTIYTRKDRKVTSMARLKSQVAMCTTQLNLGLFPEDEENVAAFLNATYYQFPAK